LGGAGVLGTPGFGVRMWRAGVDKGKIDNECNRLLTTANPLGA